MVKVLALTAQRAEFDSQSSHEKKKTRHVGSRSINPVQADGDMQIPSLFGDSSLVRDLVSKTGGQCLRYDI